MTTSLKDDIKNLIIMVSQPDGLKPYTALRFAKSAKERGKNVKAVYFGEGINCLKKGFSYDYEFKLKEALNMGIIIEACKLPMEIYGIKKEDLIEGVNILEEIMDYIFRRDTRIIWL
jgi:predicted peroxiredoxin